MDYKFFKKLSSLYEALTFTATDSVTVSDITESTRFHLESRMFYDAYRDGSEENVRIAEEIVKDRTKRMQTIFERMYAITAFLFSYFILLSLFLWLQTKKDTQYISK